MISELKTAAENWLGEQKISAAVLSSPDRIRLTAEEITDVFKYLGMRNLMAEPDTLEDLYDTSAAYAGFGMGLCEQYTEPYACEQEEYRYRTQWLLHLDFTLESLSGTVKSLKSAKEGQADKTFIFLDLGLGRLVALGTSCILRREDDNINWDAIASRIRTFVQSYRSQITRLIFTGAAASTQAFGTVVKEALQDLISESASQAILVQDGASDHAVSAQSMIDDLVFATAKGTSEFAKRRREGSVRYVEKDECKRVRQQERPAREKEVEVSLEL